MAKLFDPNRDIDNSYMMRMSHAIAEHRRVFVTLCLVMVFWFGLGGFALRNAGVGSNLPSVGSLSYSWTADDLLFWGAVAGAFFTLVGGWGWFHRQMEAERTTTAGDPQNLAAEIAKFKEESAHSAREKRLKRLRERSDG